MEYVEEFAHALETTGSMSRTAGRILAFLLTDDQPHRSLQELTAELGVSKGSVSTNTRVLIAQRMIRRVPVAGSRMEHYGLVPGGVMAMLAAAAESARHFSDLAARGQKLLGRSVTPGKAALRDLEQVHGWLADAIDDLLAKKLPEAK